MSRESFSYSHGDTGTKPGSGLDFQENTKPNAQNFDWYWNSVIEAINGHAAEFDRLDSDNDGTVDEADYALDADTVDGEEASAFVSKSGDTMNGQLDLGGNNVVGGEKVTYNTSGNDFWRLNDGSGGSNSSPFTARFDDRDLRYYAGTGVGTVWQLNQDGSVEYPEGPVTISGNRVATRDWVQNGTTRVGGSGLFFDFNNDADWIELVDGGGTRSDLVLGDVYLDKGNGWLSDFNFDDMVTGNYDIQKNGSDSNGVINFKT
jgi:hypothetical protein